MWPFVTFPFIPYAEIPYGVLERRHVYAFQSYDVYWHGNGRLVKCTLLQTMARWAHANNSIPTSTRNLGVVSLTLRKPSKWSPENMQGHKSWLWSHVQRFSVKNIIRNTIFPMHKFRESIFYISWNISETHPGSCKRSFVETYVFIHKTMLGTSKNSKFIGTRN